jgi:hypothetical protein
VRCGGGDHRSVEDLHEQTARDEQRKAAPDATGTVRITY